jgi:hypothetical protein
MIYLYPVKIFKYDQKDQRMAPFGNLSPKSLLWNSNPSFYSPLKWIFHLNHEDEGQYRD